MARLADSALPARADQTTVGKGAQWRLATWVLRSAGDRLRPSQATNRRVAALLLGIAVMTGCSDSPEASPTSASLTPTASSAESKLGVTDTPSSDPTAAAANAALDAYRGFRAAQVAAEATADARNKDLSKYAGDKALAQERANLLQLAEAGIVVKGRPVFNPKVVDVALGDSPVVTIMDCVDTTNWRPVYKATGKSAAAPGQPRRVMATALARPYDDRWVITELTTDRSRSC